MIDLLETEIAAALIAVLILAAVIAILKDKRSLNLTEKNKLLFYKLFDLRIFNSIVI